jgi:hypothetical protein
VKSKEIEAENPDIEIGANEIAVLPETVIYADPSQPHPWGNKTATEIMKEMCELLDSFKVKVPDPRPDPFDLTVPLSRAPGYSLPIYLDLIVDTEPTCDCGADKAKTTHADWCSTKGGPRT